MVKPFSHLQPRPVQFRLWGLLVVMTVVAVAAAVGAPYLRGYEPLELSLRIVCGLWFVACFGRGIELGWRRTWKLPEDSGAIIAVLPGCRYHPKKQSEWVTRWLFPVLFALGGFVAGFQFFTRPVISAVIYLTGLWIFFGYLLGLSARSRTNYPMALCEAGISLGRTFVYWSEVPLAKWESDCVNVLLLALSSDLGRIYLQVPAEDRVAVEAFVRSKTKWKD